MFWSALKGQQYIYYYDVHSLFCIASDKYNTQTHTKELDVGVTKNM